MFKLLFGGEEGISGDRTAGPRLFGAVLGGPREVYWFTACWFFAAALAMWAFTRTLDDGFDTGSAAIGAGVAAAVLLAVGGGAASHRRHRLRVDH